MSELTWEEVAARLAAAHIYWLHTSGPTGAPQASPVWGVVVDKGLYFYSERSTAKARNVAGDRRVVVHLESGRDVLIVHGLLDDLGRPATKPAVVDALAAKYSRPEERPFVPSENPDFDVLYVLRPGRAMAWALPDTEASTRRWTADTESGASD